MMLMSSWFPGKDNASELKSRLKALQATLQEKVWLLAIKEATQFRQKEDFQQQIINTTADLTRALTELSGLKQSLANAEKKLAAVEKEKSEEEGFSKDKEITNLKRSLTEVSTSLANKNEENKALHKALQQSFAAATVDLAAKEKDHVSTKGFQDDKSNEELSSVKLFLAVKEKEVAELKQSLSECRSRIATIETEMDCSKRECDAHLAKTNMDIASLQEQLAISNARFVDKQQELEVLQYQQSKDKADLQQALAEYHSKHTEKEHENAQLQKSLDEITARLQGEQEWLQQRLDASEAQKAALVQHLEMTSGEKAMLQQHVENMKQELALMQQPPVSLSLPLQQQQQQLEESQRENEVLKQLVEESAKERDALQQQLVDTINLLEGKERELRIYTDKEALQKYVAEKFTSSILKGSKKSTSSKKGSILSDGKTICSAKPGVESGSSSLDYLDDAIGSPSSPSVEEKLDFGGKTFSLKKLPAKR